MSGHCIHLWVGAVGDSGSSTVWVILGVFAGITHGFRSAILNHVLDTLLSIPSLLLAIIVVALSARLRTRHVRRLASTTAPHGAHYYSAVHDELDKEYVIAARLDGASTPHIWPMPFAEYRGSVSH
ncbi:hypothetical protein A6J63_024860 [Yersinia enterocolitica]|nr:hypothetical protein A6J63_024860 [Yersinia enterocolitica]